MSLNAARFRSRRNTTRSEYDEYDAEEEQQPEEDVAAAAAYDQEELEEFGAPPESQSDEWFMQPEQYGAEYDDRP